MTRPIRPGTKAQFEFTAVTLTTAGAQTGTVDVHLTTRKGTPAETIAVTVGDLVLYCLDRRAVQAMSTAWASAGHLAPRVLPQMLPHPDVNRHGAAVILRLASPERKAQINGFFAATSPTGLAAVRVSLGPLCVIAHDQASVASWKQIWQDAWALGQRIWPEPDAFDKAEAADNERIARRGSDGLRRSARRRT